MSVCPRNLAFCDAPSQPNPQRMTWKLSPADAARLPSGDHAVARTAPECPFRISPVPAERPLTFHETTKGPMPATKRLPSGAKAIVGTPTLSP